MAKNAAARGAAPKAHIKLLESADALVKHCLGQLGAATFGANNAVETIALENGDTVKKVRRDAQQPLRTKKGRAVQPLKLPTPAECTLNDDDVEGDHPSSEEDAPTARRSQSGTRATKPRGKFTTAELARRNSGRLVWPTGTRWVLPTSNPDAAGLLTAAASHAAAQPLSLATSPTALPAPNGLLLAPSGSLAVAARLAPVEARCKSDRPRPVKANLRPSAASTDSGVTALLGARRRLSSAEP